MRILVTGTNGQVGWEVLRKGSHTSHNILGCDRNALDVSDGQNIIRVVQKKQPDLIVNCAAYTAVDRAEEEPEKAYAVNQHGPGNLADQCAKLDIPLIHLSTDYVFNGEGNSPYKESDAISPLGVYGKSKEAGEQEVRSRCGRHIVLRTSWVYGAHGHNFLKTMLKLGQERKVLKIVNDQWGCPTYAGDIAEALLIIIDKISASTFNSWGTYHCCGSTALTWYDFATQLFSMAKDIYPLMVEDIMPIPTEQFPTPACRPAYSVLDCQKVYSTFGIKLPELPASLQSFFKHNQYIGETQ